MLAKRFFISGRVQGVGFRYFVLGEVEKIGNIRGYVRNTRDNRVEVYAEADDKQMTDLETVLRRGPYGSHVVRVDCSDEPPEGHFGDFRITH